MRIGLKGASLFTAAMLALLLSWNVAAGPIICNSMSDARYMELTPSEGIATCAGSGTGMPGNKSFHESLGLFEIEKLEDAEGSLVGQWFTINGLDATSGSIDFISTLYDEYSDIHVAFKFGFAQINPDWMSYSVEGVLNAEWAVTGQQALSNVAVWGKRKTVEVPEPGTLGLLGLGLIGLFVTIGRRHSIA